MANMEHNFLKTFRILVSSDACILSSEVWSVDYIY